MPGEGGIQPSAGRRVSPIHVFVLAIMAALSASGLVHLGDVAFATFSMVYILFLDKVPFPSRSSSAEPPVFSGRESALLGVYVLAGGVVGLFVPVAYVFEGTYYGHSDSKEGASVAAPHLFLLCCQVFMEEVTFSWQFSLPVRAFVPVLYNSKRLFTIVDWLCYEVRRKVVVVEQESKWRLQVGKGLAVANMAFWSFNLFGFLLPVYLPRVFKRYYGNVESPP